MAPSDWVQRFSRLVPPNAAVLDVACGAGRHVRWFAARGCHVTALDCDAAALLPLRELARTVEADIEAGPWPLPRERYGAVVVTNYLWRPLLPTIVGSVAPGGVLIYETFAAGNASVGKPSNPAFLLQPGELLRACAELRVIAYEDGFLAAPERFVQRIVAVRERAGAEAPARHGL